MSKGRAPLILTPQRAPRRLAANEPDMTLVIGPERAVHERHRARFAASPDEATKLLAIGQAPVDQKLNASELAAYAAVCGTILNLDEAVTKE